MAVKKRLHKTPGEDVKIVAGKGKKKDTRGSGHPVGKAGRRKRDAEARKKAEIKRQHAVDVRSGRVAGQRPTFTTRLRMAAKSVPMAAYRLGGGGGGGAGRK